MRTLVYTEENMAYGTCGENSVPVQKLETRIERAAQQGRSKQAEIEWASLISLPSPHWLSKILPHPQKQCQYPFIDTIVAFIVGNSGPERYFLVRSSGTLLPICTEGCPLCLWARWVTDESPKSSKWPSNRFTAYYELDSLLLVCSFWLILTF